MPNSSPPVRFVFGLHLHQPVGNFDHVFAQHVDDVYRPILDRLSEREFFPVVLHLSGPLLEWLEQHDHAYLDQLGALVSSGRVELLLAGFYEPILASLPRADRVEQIQWMRDAIRRRFGVEAEGLWLTERVWEPELAADLADAGVRYVLVDDRHFLVSGFPAERLYAPYRTESDGRSLSVVPIHERLRYLIPFRPPEETAEYLRSLREDGHRLAVLADDGEKFGGWPGTKEWVYERGWLQRFLTTIGGMVESGEVVLSTLREALAHVPSAGLAYLPTASYREMEGWALPPNEALQLAGLERELGEERMAGPDGSHVRGGHWRNFLVKYSESNRMQKKASALSALCRGAGDPEPARRAIGRAQCNDAYWHGVFGGLYLPHLRDAIWRNLAEAEGQLRQGQHLTEQSLDIDQDGHDEIWIHSDRFSAIVSPRRGGAIEEYTIFADGVNYANTLTRRREAYHDTALDRGAEAKHEDGGAPSIHDLEDALRLQERPPVDADDRAILIERILPADLAFDAYLQGTYSATASWAALPLAADIRADKHVIEVVLRSGNDGFGFALEKTLRFDETGCVQASYRWNPVAVGAKAQLFTVELSLAGPLTVTAPEAERWEFDIETVAKSERGFDRTRQGRSLTLRWPVALGSATITIGS